MLVVMFVLVSGVGVGFVVGWSGRLGVVAVDVVHTEVDNHIAIHKVAASLAAQTLLRETE